MMKEVAPGIFMITEKESGRIVKYSVNVFILAGEDGLVFDAGYGTRRTRRYLVKQVRAVEALMRKRGEVCRITRAIASHGHWDHFSGLRHLRDTLGITILSTRRMMKSISSSRRYRKSFRGETSLVDTPRSLPVTVWHKVTGFLLDHVWFMTFGVDFLSGPVTIIEEGTVLTIKGEPWEVIAAPGHSDDDIVLFNRERGILLAGDTILRTVTTWLGPPKSDMADYIDTLERLAALPGLRLILPAHGSPVTDPYQRLKEAVSHRKKRTEDVLTLIKKGGKKGVTFQALFQSFYPTARFYDRFILRGWILTTLEYLVNTQQLEILVRGRKKVFRAR